MSRKYFRRTLFYEFSPQCKQLVISIQLGARKALPNPSEEVGSEGSALAKWASKIWKVSCRPFGADGHQLKANIGNVLLTTARGVFQVLGVDHSIVFRHLGKTGKGRRLDRWLPHKLRESQTNRRYKTCSALLLLERNDPFLDRFVACDKCRILYDKRKFPAQSLDRIEATKHFPK